MGVGHNEVMRFRGVSGSILLVVFVLLAACGEEDASTKAGDIIKARVDDQFKDGEEATVTLPTGQLLIHATDPVDSASDDDTRIRDAVDAPAGAVLVPVSWQYDPWYKGRLDGIVATTDNPTVDLVSGSDHYRLPPPQLDDEGGESFYVVVDGDAEPRSLEIEFDGVTQTVDLTTGRIDEGDAAALYDVDEFELTKRPCDEDQWFDSDHVAAEFSCEVSGPVLTPYAAGRWAPAGSIFLALTLSTEMGVYGETDLLGSGARYTARSVDVAAEIDGEEPSYRIKNRDPADQCPVLPTISCRSSAHLIFEVPEEDGEQGPLALDISYQLTLLDSWGNWAEADRRTVNDEGTFKLWEEERDDAD